MSEQFVRDYQQDQYNQIIQEIRNRPIGGADGRGRGGVGGGAGNAASWAVLLAMLGAVVGAILVGTGGAVALALVGAGLGWGRHGRADWPRRRGAHGQRHDEPGHLRVRGDGRLQVVPARAAVGQLHCRV
jgi:hypothetical protein